MTQSSSEKDGFHTLLRQPVEIIRQTLKLDDSAQVTAALWKAHAAALTVHRMDEIEYLHNVVYQPAAKRRDDLRESSQAMMDMLGSAQEEKADDDFIDEAARELYGDAASALEGTESYDEEKVRLLAGLNKKSEQSYLFTNKIDSAVDIVRRNMKGYFEERMAPASTEFYDLPADPTHHYAQALMLLSYHYEVNEKTGVKDQFTKALFEVPGHRPLGQGFVAAFRHYACHLYDDAAAMLAKVAPTDLAQFMTEAAEAINASVAGQDLSLGAFTGAYKLSEIGISRELEGFGVPIDTTHEQRFCEQIDRWTDLVTAGQAQQMRLPRP